PCGEVEDRQRSRLCQTTPARYSSTLATLLPSSSGLSATHPSRAYVSRPHAMDAFFTIAPPVPVEDPTADVLIDRDDTGTSGDHGSCIIA
ncbi:hypothetical protein BV20DRAFT_8523, partial [Pilatotrama ljubarskyi]